tara:strand:- start:808 stop:969 length:162 start_codon:yes stop_codon:yes gene_type:complete
MLNNELNYEEANERLLLFIKKQSERIEKLRTKCNKRKGCGNNKKDVSKEEKKG